MEKCEWELISDENENHYESDCGGEWFFLRGPEKRIN
jgi:hypothetical protein